MRIASLVPSATEMLCALGLRDSLVAVTHECDYPEGIELLPHLTRSVIPDDLTPAEIDAAVRERTEKGESIYELDAELLHELEPDLIVTQALCEVCAVSVDDVRAVARELASEPNVLSLDPSTIGEVVGDVRTLAQATDEKDAGVDLVRELADRLDRVKVAVRSAEPRPRVLALEWLDPPFAGGHWVPQMIELAGGEDPIGFAGERSREASWAELAAVQPDIVVSMPCGYYAERAAHEVMEHREEIARLGAGQVVAVDAAAYFSRPGPRLVDGVELLAHILHPDLVDAPPAGRFIEIDLSAALRST
ncbi:MAG TPA: cobalamin-binding protein [Thermoleophilaceae bacterium]|nr:cobalamin-binding protein [Thermoleophilaceae bacterium]